PDHRRRRATRLTSDGHTTPRAQRRGATVGVIRIVENGSVPWMVQAPGETRQDEHRQFVEIAEPGPSGASRYLHPGNDSEPYLHESSLPPDTPVDVHAHHTDEIIYVLDGELVLGARVVGPGASIYIPGMTLYQFRSGPNGLRFLNFRGHRDRSHL